MGIQTFVRHGMTLGVCVAFLLAAFTSLTLAQDEPALVSGKNEFVRHCGACHGADGKGDGPIVPLLKEKPADLTGIAQRNGGDFPFWETFQMIDGRAPIDGHGGREMPVWGDRFREDAPSSSQGSEALVRARIMELILYLQSIQAE